jgi:hypothetical protein
MASKEHMVLRKAVSNRVTELVEGSTFERATYPAKRAVFPHIMSILFTVEGTSVIDTLLDQLKLSGFNATFLGRLYGTNEFFIYVDTRS